MLLSEQGPQAGKQTIDIRVSIPEVEGVSSFWIREYPTRHTFSDLYQECINHTGAGAARKVLEEVRASRHFWLGEQMLLREQLLSALPTTGTPGPMGRQEISLALRRDFYHVEPVRLLKTGAAGIYINAEAPTKEVVEQILTGEECAACFNLTTGRGRRVPHHRSLAEENLWPAWEDAPPAEFPARARLLLRPRVSKFPYVLYVFALAVGGLVGFYLLSALLVHPPS